MNADDLQPKRRRLLVFNCHEAWVYQLRCLDVNLDIITGLPGRYCRQWDTCMRPLPPRSRLLTLEQARCCPRQYEAIICHNPTDLLDIKHRPEPRLLMLHLSLEARVVEEAASVDAREFARLVGHYLHQVGAVAVAVTAAKAHSWGLSEHIVESGIDPVDFAPHCGDIAAGIRVCNFIKRRQRFTEWEFHQAAFAGLPVRMVGHNPGMDQSGPSRDWDHLRNMLCHHRFYIHAADPALEDGFNMAVMEAMAAGLPVLGNVHPTSPIEHGVTGFLSDHPQQLRRYAERLLADPNLARRMGQAAREAVSRRFPLSRFKTGMEHVLRLARERRRKTLLQQAQQRWGQAPLPDAEDRSDRVAVMAEKWFKDA